MIYEAVLDGFLIREASQVNWSVIVCYIVINSQVELEHFLVGDMSSIAHHAGATWLPDLRQRDCCLATWQFLRKKRHQGPRTLAFYVFGWF